MKGEMAVASVARTRPTAGFACLLDAFRYVVTSHLSRYCHLVFNVPFNDYILEIYITLANTDRSL